MAVKISEEHFVSHENYVKFKVLIHKVLMDHCQAPLFRCSLCLLFLYDSIIR